MPQKRTSYTPKNSDAMQEKFINYIMREGKKEIARRIFTDMLKELEKRGQKKPLDTFKLAIENARPTMEVRPKRIGGGVYQIPIEVTQNRQIMLSFRWIITAAKERKGAPMAKKLAIEILDTANGTGAAIKKKEDTHRMAQANRAFAHFARY